MSLTFSPINELPFAPNFEGNDYLLIWDISQPANQARRLTFTALASYLAYTNRQLDWDDITNKPTSFTPATHTHIPADIVGLDILQIGAIQVTRQYFINSGFVVIPSSQSFDFLPNLSADWKGIFIESFSYQIMANVYQWDSNNYQSFQVRAMALNGIVFNLSQALALEAVADFQLRKRKIDLNIASYFSTLSDTVNRFIRIAFIPVGNINGLMQFSLFYRGIL